MVCLIAFVRLVMLLLLSCTDLQHQTFHFGNNHFLLKFPLFKKVLAPKELVDSIGKRIKAAAKLYE